MADWAGSSSADVSKLNEFTDQSRSVPPAHGRFPLLPTRLSLLSVEYMIQPSVNCLVLLRQEIPKALALARVRAGSNRPARIAMMAITTSSSIRVKPSEVFGLFGLCIFTGWDLRLVRPLTLPQSADDG